MYGQNLVDVDPRSIGVLPADQLTTSTWLTKMPGVSSGGGIDERVVATLTKAATSGD
jgi:hypothetical protein